MGEIRKYLKVIVLILLIIFIFLSYIQYKKIEVLNNELSLSKSNEKAFIAENNNLKEDNRAFKFTIDQLNYFNDSLINDLNTVRKELKIKDRDLKQMQYILSKAQKKDTIVFKDTIFLDKYINIDTLIGDEWYQLQLGLEYPNKIIANPSFKSEKYIIVGNKKETIDPPKKFFILRWFQKRHKIVEVNIIEKNPYIENKKQKFIEIID
jgi:hypothetical protein